MAYTVEKITLEKAKFILRQFFNVIWYRESKKEDVQKIEQVFALLDTISDLDHKNVIINDIPFEFDKLKEGNMVRLRCGLYSKIKEIIDDIDLDDPIVGEGEYTWDRDGRFMRNDSPEDIISIITFSHIES